MSLETFVNWNDKLILFCCIQSLDVSDWLNSVVAVDTGGDVEFMLLLSLDMDWDHTKAYQFENRRRVRSCEGGGDHSHWRWYGNVPPSRPLFFRPLYVLSSGSPFSKPLPAPEIPVLFWKNLAFQDQFWLNFSRDTKF